MPHKYLNRLILVGTFIIAAWFMASYIQKSRTFYGDSLGYYMYLPATFIYHNLDAVYQLPTDKKIDNSILWYVDQSKETSRTPKGYQLNQYTYGVALMELPFFLVAHVYEKMNGLSANGYTATYYYMLQVSTLCYALLGLLLVYLVLKKYYSKTVSLLSIAFIFLGTNMFWFSLYQPGMAHIPIFFLYALLIYLTITVYQKPRLFLFIAIGCTAGLITIIRPTDIICLLIPLLYDVYNKETLIKKYLFIKQHFAKVLLLALAFIVPLVPQFIYWKILAGSFLYYSYAGQSFNWVHPKIIEGLFYFKNGWLAYSTIMIFSLLGSLMYKQIKSWAWCIWIIFPLYVYAIYSWYCFNYINGLGSRPMIHLYPLLAIPFAAFIYFISRQRVYIQAAFYTLALFFTAVNINYSMQKALGMLNSEESNMYYNFEMLFRTHLQYNDLVCYDTGEIQPDSNKVTKLCTLACLDFDDSVSTHYIKGPAYASKYVYHMQAEEEYLPKLIRVTYNKEKFKGAKWFKCSGKFMYTDPPNYYKHLLVLDIKRDTNSVLWESCKVENKIGIIDDRTKKEDISFDHYKLNTWGYVYCYIKIPPKISDGDQISFFIWNTAKTELYVDDLCLELYKDNP